MRERLLNLDSLRDSVVLWPATAVYLLGIASTVLIAGEYIDLGTGLAIFGVLSILVVLVSIARELRKVAVTVNVQHDALLSRVEQLDLALRDAGLRVPEYPEPAPVTPPLVPPRQRSGIRSRRSRATSVDGMAQQRTGEGDER